MYDYSKNIKFILQGFMKTRQQINEYNVCTCVMMEFIIIFF